MNGNAQKPVNFVSLKYKKKKENYTCKWKISQDTTKLMFVAELDGNKKKNNYKAYVCLLDNDLNKSWEKPIKMEYSQKQVKTWSWELTNSGEIYFVAKIYDNKKEKESHKSKLKKWLEVPAYTIKIININNIQKDITSIDIKMNNSFTKGLKLIANENSDIFAAGIYGDTPLTKSILGIFGGNSSVVGIFYSKIRGVDNSILYSYRREFTEKEIKSFGEKYTKNENKTKNYGLNGAFELMDVIVLDDGTYRVVLEENFILEANDKYSNRTYFNSNLIILMNIDNLGKVQNISVIPKRQSFANYDQATSYSVMRTNDNAYFLYNDNKANLKKNILDPDQYKKLKKYNKCVAVLAHFEGNILKRKQLFDHNVIKTTLLAKSSKQIDNNNMIFFTWKGPFLRKGKFRFGTVNVK